MADFFFYVLFGINPLSIGKPVTPHVNQPVSYVHSVAFVTNHHHHPKQAYVSVVLDSSGKLIIDCQFDLPIRKFKNH